MAKADLGLPGIALALTLAVTADCGGSPGMDGAGGRGGVATAGRGGLGGSGGLGGGGLGGGGLGGGGLGGGGLGGAGLGGAGTGSAGRGGAGAGPGSAGRGGGAAAGSGGAGGAAVSGAAGAGGRGAAGGRGGGNGGAGAVGGEGGAQAGFGFFAFGDLHSGQATTTAATLATAMAQMKRIDPAAAIAFSNGDLVDDATSADWSIHDTAIAMASFRPDLTSFGSGIRYLATTDNHDRGFPIERANWLALWNQHLPGQMGLGHTAADGIYYAVTYQNTMFIVLDSQRPSAAQTSWLATLLASSAAKDAQVKLAFFHQPVYPCISEHPPFADGLAWVDLFEKNNVRLVFVSHMHMYDRTCPLLGGMCRTDGTGVVFQQLGPLGANNFRTIDRTTVTVTGTDAAGGPRTDTYRCSGSGSIVATSRSNVNDFCHVRVEGCRIIGACYVVQAGNTTPFDTWEVRGC